MHQACRNFVISLLALHIAGALADPTPSPSEEPSPGPSASPSESPSPTPSHSPSPSPTWSYPPPQLRCCGIAYRTQSCKNYDFPAPPTLGGLAYAWSEATKSVNPEYWDPPTAFGVAVQLRSLSESCDVNWTNRNDYDDTDGQINDTRHPSDYSCSGPAWRSFKIYRREVDVGVVTDDANAYAECWRKWSLE